MDTLDYSGASSVVSALVGRRVRPGHLARCGLGQSRRNFENVTGSPGGDTLIGDGGDNVLRGLGGDDTLQGGTGDDTIEGGFRKRHR